MISGGRVPAAIRAVGGLAHPPVLPRDVRGLGIEQVLPVVHVQDRTGVGVGVVARGQVDGDVAVVSQDGGRKLRMAAQCRGWLGHDVIGIGLQYRMAGTAEPDRRLSSIHASRISPLVLPLAATRHGTPDLRSRRPAGRRLSDLDGRVLRVRRPRHGRRARLQTRPRAPAAVLRLVRGRRKLVQPAHSPAPPGAAPPALRGLPPERRGAARAAPHRPGHHGRHRVQLRRLSRDGPGAAPPVRLHVVHDDGRRLRHLAASSTATSTRTATS